MKTRAAIAITGALGFVTVLKTSLYYASLDHVAFGLTLLMAFALVSGLVELWRVTHRVEDLTLELRALPKDASADRLAQASASLHALLRARLDRSYLAVPVPVFAPYLAGLLVMLGLLGTFLGLFETLRGASIALTTGSDVDALRAGLKTPMLGLMRSFGTSAAGVSASAMLGLSTVFARKAAAQLALELQEMTAGPLSHLSESRRQLAAFESLSTALAAALTAQERAVPDAAEALQKAHDTLAARTTTIDAAIDRQLKSMQEAVDRLCQHLQQSEGDARARLVATLSAIQDSQVLVAERLSSYESSTASKLAEAIHALAAEREKQAQRLTSLEENLASKLGETVAVLGLEHEQQAQRFARVEADLATQLSAAGQGLLQVESAAAEQQRALAEKLETFLSAQEERSAQWQTAALERHGQQAEKLSELFARQLEAMHETHSQSGALILEAATLVKAGGAELVTVAETFGAAVEQQRQSLRAWLDSLGEIERSVTGAGEAAAADVLGEHLARTHEVFDRQLRFQQEVVEQLRAASKRDVAPEPGADASA